MAPITKGTYQNERAIFFGRWDAFPSHLVPVSSPPPSLPAHRAFTSALADTLFEPTVLHSNLHPLRLSSKNRRAGRGGSSAAFWIGRSTRVSPPALPSSALARSYQAPLADDTFHSHYSDSPPLHRSISTLESHLCTSTTSVNISPPCRPRTTTRSRTRPASAQPSHRFSTSQRSSTSQRMARARVWSGRSSWTG